ncbi:MAG: serine protease, partial [Deltaproteobacteria bacterium]|nr:serine protease [Deltaproteobacteria bacterium]
AFMLCAAVAQAKTAAEVFEKVSPSVVVIRAYDAKGKNTMLGSGVALEDGVVVTNCHVVKEAVTMQVERQER